VKDMKMRTLSERSALVHDANNMLMVLLGSPGRPEYPLSGLQMRGYPHFQQLLENAERKLKHGSANYSPFCHALNAVDGYLRTYVFREYSAETLEARPVPEIVKPAAPEQEPVPSLDDTFDAAIAEARKEERTRPISRRPAARLPSGDRFNKRIA